MNIILMEIWSKPVLPPLKHNYLNEVWLSGKTDIHKYQENHDFLPQFSHMSLNLFLLLFDQISLTAGIKKYILINSLLMNSILGSENNELYIKNAAYMVMLSVDTINS